MINAKEEFLDHIGERQVLSARILIDHIESLKYDCLFLFEEFDAVEFHKFIQGLDFNYFEGYGLQYLRGHIHYTDGTWSERREYDGSEWWQHVERPARIFKAK